MIYTIPSCPECSTLKAWPGKVGNSFVERDLTDPKVMAEAKAKTGFGTALITAIEDQAWSGTFQTQKQGIIAALSVAAIG